MRIVQRHLRPGYLWFLALAVVSFGMTAFRRSAADDEVPLTQSNVPTRVSATFTDRAVQDRLKLSKEQREIIARFETERDAALTRLKESSLDGKGQFSPHSREIRTRFEGEVREALSPEQHKGWLRLKRIQSISLLGPSESILRDEVQKELKLTDGQFGAIDGLQKEYCAACERLADEIDDLPEGTPWFEQPLMKRAHEVSLEMSERLNPLLETTLTPAQNARWSQIQWQEAVVDRGPVVMLDKYVIEYLDLTDKQRDEIDHLSDDTKRQVGQLQPRDWLGPARIRAANMKKALTLLNSDQKQCWDQLLGAPFKSRLFEWMSREVEKSDDEKKEP
jgi:hypothetical protein